MPYCMHLYIFVIQPLWWVTFLSPIEWHNEMGLSQGRSGTGTSFTSRCLESFKDLQTYLQLRSTAIFLKESLLSLYLMFLTPKIVFLLWDGTSFLINTWVAAACDKDIWKFVHWRVNHADLASTTSWRRHCVLHPFILSPEE